MSAPTDPNAPWLLTEDEDADVWGKLLGNRAGLEMLKGAIEKALNEPDGKASLGQNKYLPFDEVELLQGTREEALKSKIKAKTALEKVRGGILALIFIILFPLAWGIGLVALFTAIYHFFSGGN